MHLQQSSSLTAVLALTAPLLASSWILPRQANLTSPTTEAPAATSLSAIAVISGDDPTDRTFLYFPPAGASDTFTYGVNSTSVNATTGSYVTLNNDSTISVYPDPSDLATNSTPRIIYALKPHAAEFSNKTNSTGGYAHFGVRIVASAPIDENYVSAAGTFTPLRSTLHSDPDSTNGTNSNGTVGSHLSFGNGAYRSFRFLSNGRLVAFPNYERTGPGVIGTGPKRRDEPAPTPPEGATPTEDDEEVDGTYHTDAGELKDGLEDGDDVGDDDEPDDDSDGDLDFVLVPAGTALDSI